jgi:hypothetical protein
MLHAYLILDSVLLILVRIFVLCFCVLGPDILYFSSSYQVKSVEVYFNSDVFRLEIG